MSKQANQKLSDSQAVIVRPAPQEVKNLENSWSLGDQDKTGQYGGQNGV